VFSEATLASMAAEALSSVVQEQAADTLGEAAMLLNSVELQGLRGRGRGGTPPGERGRGDGSRRRGDGFVGPRPPDFVGPVQPQLGAPVAARIVLNVLLCVVAASLLTATTPLQRLLDGVVSLARPFKRFGADPERFALTIAIMLRSIPFIAGAFADVRDSARARGLERNPRALILPVFITTVAYARHTGDALAARGLGEPEDH
jgi:energy-coupling factor transporter transmembrane protein EcfT